MAEQRIKISERFMLAHDMGKVLQEQWRRRGKRTDLSDIEDHRGA